ncbi:MAG: SWIM zinc finger family protein [Hyphomicrobiaceae bacterium]
MALRKDVIEALAPDQSSLAAALKLLKPASWPTIARDASVSLLWGECQGSGASPYRVVVALPDLGYKCTCPSRKFPCKHVLAVMWMQVDKPDRFLEVSPPEWVADWLSRRRPKVAAAPRSDGEANVPRSATKSFDSALADAESEGASADAPPDPKATARAAAQRERLKQEREAAIQNGLDELDRWIVARRRIERMQCAAASMPLSRQWPAGLATSAIESIETTARNVLTA